MIVPERISDASPRKHEFQLHNHAEGLVERLLLQDVIIWKDLTEKKFEQKLKG